MSTQTTITGYIIRAGDVRARVNNVEDDTWLVRVVGAPVFVPLSEFPSRAVALHQTKELVEALAQERGSGEGVRERAQAAVREFRSVAR